MGRFLWAAGLYAAVCIAIMIGIALRGDGPHPRVVSVYPPNGDLFWPGGTVKVSFSQFMDQSSVERALQVSPSPQAQGQGIWTGTSLNLQPVGDWRPDILYHLSFVGTVTDEEGRPLHTPISFWFRVHHVEHLTSCPVAGVRNVCERLQRGLRPLTHSPTAVQQYALSPDGSLLAYTRSDTSGLPHLFLIGVDGRVSRQLTRGRSYADFSPVWTTGDSSDVSYRRRSVVWHRSRAAMGKEHLWNIQIDGTTNVPE